MNQARETKGSRLIAFGCASQTIRKTVSRLKNQQDYREIDYELLFRNYEAGYDRMPWINSGMPNRKTDTNNRDGFSTDFIGQNYDYPEASYEERER